MLLSSSRAPAAAGASPVVVSSFRSAVLAGAVMGSTMASTLLGLAAPAHAERTGQWQPGGGLTFSESATEEGPGNKRSAVARRSLDSLTGAPTRRRLSKAAVAELSPRRKGRRVRVASLGHSLELGKTKAGRGRADRRKPPANARSLPIAPEAQPEVEVASLGPAFELPKPSEPLTGNINWQANAECLAPPLKSVIDYVASNFGSVRVTSTCRNHAHNRRVGGVRNSFHLTGSAADFRLSGDVRGAIGYLKGSVGWLKHYGGGLFHIDTGPSVRTAERRVRPAAPKSRTEGQRIRTASAARARGRS